MLDTAKIEEFLAAADGLVKPSPAPQPASKPEIGQP